MGISHEESSESQGLPWRMRRGLDSAAYPILMAEEPSSTMIVWWYVDILGVLSELDGGAGLCCAAPVA